MADIPPLNVRVNIDASGVQQGVSQTTAGLEQISNKAKTTTTSLGKFKTVALGVFGGNILTAGIFGIQKVLTGMRDEVVATEVETQRLMNALDNMTGITNENRSAIEQNVAAYATLGFQDADATRAMGTLITATGDLEQANKLMAMSADLARYKHIDLDTAARILARGTQGSAKAFKEMGITLDTTISKNAAISKAFDELNGKIGGQATAYTKTFAGQMAVLKEQLDGVAIAVGKYLVPFFTKLAQLLGSLFSYVQQNATALKIFGGILITVGIAVKTYTTILTVTKAVQQAYAFWTYAQAASTNVFAFAMYSLNAAIKANPIMFIVSGLVLLAAGFAYAWKHSQTFRNIVVSGLQIVLKAFSWLVEKIGTLLNVMSKIPGMGFLKKFATDADKAAKSIAKTAENLDKLRKLEAKDTTPKIAGITKPGGNTGITANVPGGDAAGVGGGGGSKTTIQYVTVYATNTNDIAKKLSAAAKYGTPIGNK